MAADVERPLTFIGSSGEGESIARAVERNLNIKSETYLWRHTFAPGKSNLESLVEKAPAFDFGVLVLTPDDVIESRGVTMNSPRDNLLFELGLFIGRLGRERTFAVYNSEEPLKLPSDLAGVTLSPYRQYKNKKKNLEAQVSAACTPILEAIDSLGLLIRLPAINPRYDFDLLTLDGTFKLSDIVNRKTVVVVVGDTIVGELLDRQSAGLLRDEISRLSDGDPFKRAIILGHHQWTTEAWLHGNPTISIGGKALNELTDQIVKAREASGKLKSEEGPGGWSAFTPAAPPLGPRVALWGAKAIDTRTAVQHYISRREGLPEFLDVHGGWKTA
jgi:Predicted nucleotide-binding protein containing TIR-like domain